MKPKSSNPSSPLKGQYAGFVSRLVAYTIDLLVVVAAIALLGITVDLFLRFFHLEELVDTLLASQNALGDILRFLTFLGSVAFISFSYFVFGWTLTAGQSIGKLLIGIRIVPLDGSKITLWRSTIRYFAFLLSALVLFIGLLWVLISDSRQGWHDKIARTCVIYDWAAHEDDGVIGQWKGRRNRVKPSRLRSGSKGARNNATDNDSELEVAPEETESA
jgi:uncharacterized RDD family membrane protein YckC